MDNCEDICAWCKKPLNEDSVKKLQCVLTTHSTVQPNCGEHSCMRRNAGGSDGWTIKRPKKTKISKEKPKPKPKPSLKPKPKPKTKPKPNSRDKPRGSKRRGPPEGQPPGKRKKEDS